MTDDIYLSKWRDRIVYHLCRIVFLFSSPEYRTFCNLTWRFGKKVLDQALDLDAKHVYVRVSTEPFTEDERDD